MNHAKLSTTLVTLLGSALLFAACGRKPAERKILVRVVHPKKAEVVKAPATTASDATATTQPANTAGADTRSQPAAASNAPVRVTWALVKEKVLDPSCAGCHGAGNASGRTDLTTYESTKSVLGTLVHLTLLEESAARMPPPPMPALTREQKLLLSTWLADGALAE